MDLFSQYGLVAVREAVQDSGLDFAREDAERVGVIWGSGIGGLRSLEEQIEKHSDYIWVSVHNHYCFRFVPTVNSIRRSLIPNSLRLFQPLQGHNHDNFPSRRT